MLAHTHVLSLHFLQLLWTYLGLRRAQYRGSHAWSGSSSQAAVTQSSTQPPTSTADLVACTGALCDRSVGLNGAGASNGFAATLVWLGRFGWENDWRALDECPAAHMRSWSLWDLHEFFISCAGAGQTATMASSSLKSPTGGSMWTCRAPRTKSTSLSTRTRKFAPRYACVCVCSRDVLAQPPRAHRGPSCRSDAAL